MRWSSGPNAEYFEAHAESSLSKCKHTAGSSRRRCCFLWASGQVGTHTAMDTGSPFLTPVPASSPPPMLLVQVAADSPTGSDWSETVLLGVGVVCLGVFLPLPEWKVISAVRSLNRKRAPSHDPPPPPPLRVAATAPAVMGNPVPAPVPRVGRPGPPAPRGHRATLPPVATRQPPHV